ncbi:HlyC/CorC family transporter [Methylocapsa sp. S129]|uniref:HlyC/CorC family transporter n=1 Tax=Methylocapsa sp. S129 TaxID=1641869 RepID=UPI00131CF72C|nr:HlyC/CorC family transporter [Methylocapsa sp. S129]
MSLTVDALIVLASVFASAFFSGAETALTAASRARMHALEMDGDQSAKLVNRLIAMRGRLISAMLFGGQIVNIAVSAFATSVLVALAGDRGVVYATAIMTAMIVIFGEVLPKTVAIAYPDRVSLLIAPVVSFFVTIFWPVVAAIETFVRGLLWLCGMRASERQSIASGHEELRGAVDLLHREGGVARSERDMFGALLELDEIEVSEVMIHRTNMGTINADLPPADLIREVLASPYTRLPLWRGQPDNIIGVLHAKDLFRALAAAGGDSSRIDIEDIALDVWFIPDTTTLRDQLQAFLRRKTHFAMVVDEYGVVMGLVTLEDIIEEIVGDIKDEHDVAAQGMRPQPDGSVIVEGSVTIRDLNRAMDWTLPDEEATTIAGLVIHEARAIPEPRQAFIFHGFRFEVLRKNRNRIAALRISAVTAPKGKGQEKDQESEGDAAVRD